MGICVYKTGIYEIDCPDLAQPIFEGIDQILEDVGRFIGSYEGKLIFFTALVVLLILAVGYAALNFVRKVKAGEKPFNDIKAAVMLITASIGGAMVDVIGWDRPLRAIAFFIGLALFEEVGRAIERKAKNDRA